MEKLKPVDGAPKLPVVADAKLLFEGVEGKPNAVGLNGVLALVKLLPPDDIDGNDKEVCVLGCVVLLGAVLVAPNRVLCEEDSVEPPNRLVAAGFESEPNRDDDGTGACDWLVEAPRPPKMELPVLGAPKKDVDAVDG